MAPPASKSFRAVLEPLRNGLGWTIARIPFDVAKAWPVRNRLRVRGEVEGLAFRTTLFGFSKSGFSGGEGHFLLVNKKMQKAACASVGAAVRITLQPDMEERLTEIPAELAQALQGDRRLRKWFDRMSASARREIGHWVNEPKSAASREKRAEQMAERLVLVLEGETELPPILYAAFERDPMARLGWQAMTSTQRRGHLFGIFGYQSVESREKRAAKAVEEALRVAQKKRQAAK